MEISLQQKRLLKTQKNAKISVSKFLGTKEVIPETDLWTEEFPQWVGERVCVYECRYNLVTSLENF